MIKHIEIDDLIFLILIQSLFFITINTFDSDSIKFIISEILDYSSSH